MGDRVAVMRKGLLQQFDAPQRLYEAPANLFVASFIGSPSMNMLEGTLRRGADGIVCFEAEHFSAKTDAGGHSWTKVQLPSGGSIVNQVQRVYNGLGQLITEYQSHSGAVNTSTSPKVQYGYSGVTPVSVSRGTGNWQWPVGGYITQDYWSGHRAVDIGTRTGNAVWAADAGYIVFVGWDAYGYGNHIIVNHGNGFETLILRGQTIPIAF